ncbi:MAG: GLUG motif-containing protein [Planctomycetota bacterium]
MNDIKLVVVVVCVFAGAAFGQYCSASGENYNFEHISGVELGAISNTATGGSNYTDYTHLSTEMHIGVGYSITVTNGDSYSGDQCGVWVDWNADEDFNDVNEMIVMSGGPGTFTGTITPPEAAPLGATQIRVRIMYTGVLSPCGATDFGEVEDYTIVVIEPYEIWTAGELQAIGADTNYWDKRFLLMADIDLSAYTGTSFNIIGTSSTEFTGIFDGNGHTISSFTYDSNGTNNIGLFGYVDGPSAEIKNLGLIEPNVDAGTGDFVGSLVGFIEEGSITNCYVEGGSVSGNEWVGGLAGYKFSGTISDCYVDDTSVSGSGDFVGGLVGSNGGSISGSHSTGSVSGDRYVGGLAGYNPGEINRCYSASNVIGNKFVGGLVGNNGGDMGIGSIANSYSTGSVRGAGATGGLVGFNAKGDIMNCYSTGSVSGNAGVGGLVGQNWDGSVFHSYSASSVDGNSIVGGLAGGNFGVSDPDYTKCFWDVNVNPDVNGISNADDPNVIGKTTVQMQIRSTFTNAGWDFVGEVINGPDDIWDICEGTNYPKLAWQIQIPLPGDFSCPDGVDFIDYSFFAEHWEETDYGDVDGVELSGDGRVNWEDFGLFAEWWMESGCGGCGGADFTGEGDVNYLDLDVFAWYWLESEYGDCGGAELTGDGVVGPDDLREFTENWLAGL